MFERELAIKAFTVDVTRDDGGTTGSLSGVQLCACVSVRLGLRLEFCAVRVMEKRHN